MINKWRETFGPGSGFAAIWLIFIVTGLVSGLEAVIFWSWVAAFAFVLSTGIGLAGLAYTRHEAKKHFERSTRGS